MPAASRVTYLVKRLELAVRRELDEIVGDFGVTALQYTALSALARHPGLSGAQLARRAFVSPQAGSEMVRILQRKGLISRSPHAENGRVLCIVLSRAGEKLLAACDPAVEDLERRMLKRLSDKRAEDLRDALGSCIDELSTHERHDTAGDMLGSLDVSSAVAGARLAVGAGRRSARKG